MTRKQQIADNGKPNQYFHVMLNMADDDLDPYEYRLLGHYIRVCGKGDAGACWEGTRTTAEACKMSVGKVSATRKSLEEKGYVLTQAPGTHDKGRGDTVLVTVVNRWAENIARYDGLSSGEQPAPSVHVVNTGVHVVNAPVHDMKQRRTIEEEPLKKERENAPAQSAEPAPTPETPLSPSKQETPTPDRDVTAVAQTPSQFQQTANEIPFRRTNDAIAQAERTGRALPALNALREGLPEKIRPSIRELKSSETKAIDMLEGGTTPEQIKAKAAEMFAVGISRINLWSIADALQEDKIKAAQAESGISKATGKPAPTATRTDGQKYFLGLDENFEPIYGDKPA